MATLGEYLGAGSGITKGLYHLNGSSTDSSGNGLNGTDTSMSYVDGLFGQCGSFGGTSSIALGTSASLRPTAALTLSVWVNYTNNAAVRKVFQASNNGYGIYINNADSTINFFGYYNGSGGFTNLSHATVNDGKWHHLLGTITASGNILFYIDGVSTSSAYGGSTISYTAHTTRIGESGATGQPRIGSIDEVILENVVWTPAQVKKYYTYSKGRYGNL